MVYQGELGVVCLEEKDDDTTATALPELRQLVLFRSSKTASYCWSVDRVLATSVKSLQDLRSSCHGACQEMAQIGGGF